MAPKRNLRKEEIMQGKIKKVQLDVAELAKRIKAFESNKKDNLDEMLMRHVLSLDSIENREKR